MSTRNRLVVVLAGAVLALSPGVALTMPAEASVPKPLLSVQSTLNENVTFGAAGYVAPITVGRLVDLQVKSRSRWKTIDTVKQDQYGGLTFSAKLKRTSKAKAKTGYQWRSLRMRARASGSLKTQTTAAKKVKLMLDPKVYYRVLRSSVQHTADANLPANGCGIGAPFVATKKTSSGLGKAETGRPRWRGMRLANGTIEITADPGLVTTWSQNLSGCRHFPSPAQTCTTTRVDKPTGDGRERLGVRIQVPKKGSKGTALFFTRTLSVGYSSADDSVCNVPYMTGTSVPTKIRTKTVSRSTLLGKKPFTIVNQGQTSWKTDAISGKPADLKLRWTESITLQRVDASGRTLK